MRVWAPIYKWKLFSTWLNQNRKGELQKRPSLVRLRAQIYLLVHEIFYLAEPKEKRTTAKEAGFGEAVGPDMSACARYFLHG